MLMVGGGGLGSVAIVEVTCRFSPPPTSVRELQVEVNGKAREVSSGLLAFSLFAEQDAVLLVRGVGQLSMLCSASSPTSFWHGLEVEYGTGGNESWTWEQTIPAMRQQVLLAKTQPTRFPTRQKKVSVAITKRPTKRPTKQPTKRPTKQPSHRPTKSPAVPTSRRVHVTLPSKENVGFISQALYTCELGDVSCNLELMGRCALSTKLVVYKFTAPATARFVFSTNSPLTTCTDTVMQLSPSLICNDDISKSNTKSLIKANLIEGEVYTLYVGSYGDTCAGGGGSNSRVAVSVKLATFAPTKRPSTLIPTSRPTSPTTRTPTRKGATRRPSHRPAQVPVPPRYTIQLLLPEGISSIVQAAFDSAAARWSEVISQPLPGYVVLSPGLNCGYLFEEETRVGDLLIVVRIFPIDGPLGVLGSAGPCLTDEMGMTRVGTMSFDSDDLDWMVEAGTLANVVLHEMGHVLGIGTLWADLVGYRVLPHTGGYEYLGDYGNQGHAEIGGKRAGLGAAAIVEDGALSGTSRVHWKESVYTTELMTGYVNDGENMPLSLLSLQALRDLGYLVDLSKADKLQLPMAGAGESARRPTNKIALVGCIHDLPMQSVPSFAKE
ncbi:hypothetical protein BASA81_002286 [Batrachochytrium salamandrivorans]|nr:hypothetical protein BASA81_002286 [Batrachochytrium salamandrivorans]